MVEAQNKVVSIEAFRATRAADRETRTSHRRPAGLSPRSIEHRERMLQYLRMEAAERAQRAHRLERRLESHDAQEVQGRLLP